MKNKKRFKVNFDAKSEAYMFILYIRYMAKTREQKEAAVKVWNHNCGAMMKGAKHERIYEVT